jgi:hypothetical protein
MPKDKDREEIQRPLRSPAGQPQQPQVELEIPLPLDSWPTKETPTNQEEEEPTGEPIVIHCW